MIFWVIIPAYNEEKTLGGLLVKLSDKGFPVLVIDDGSTDGTFEIAQKKSALFIKNERNMGKGLSIKRAIKYLSRTENFDFIVTMDADGQHSADDLSVFIKEAEMGAEVIVGNRMRNTSAMPLIRVWTNRVMSWFISLIAGQKIPDTQCGFRAISRKVIESINISSDKFEIESEILIKAARSGVKIKSVPVKSIYTPAQKSSIRPFTDTLRFIAFISRINHDKH